MKGLLTLDVLELPFGRRNNEVELRRIVGQGLEDQGEAQLLVGPGDLGGAGATVMFSTPVSSCLPPLFPLI